MSLRSIKSKGWDGSVRGKIAKGHFVQGLQHPRIFGRGHIGRGWTNIAPIYISGVFDITACHKEVDGIQCLRLQGMVPDLFLAKIFFSF